MENTNKYDYREAIKKDVREYIAENWSKAEAIECIKAGGRDQMEEQLNDDLWLCDSVTGNASGSYTFNRAKAEEYVKDNLALCIDALQEFGVDEKTFGEKVYNEEWEYLDVIIRCNLLCEAISNVLDGLEEEAMEHDLQDDGNPSFF